MSSFEYINALAARGIELWAQDGKLQYKAPKDAVTPALLAELKQHKAALLTLLEQVAGTAGHQPLSYSQKSLWSLHQLNPGSAAYNVTYAAWLDDDLDAAALSRCVDHLVARHSILRTRYAVVDGQPVQLASLDASARLEVVRVFGANEAAVRQWVEDEANRPFDLRVSPIRLKLLVNEPAEEGGTPRQALLLNVHHIAADFWSLEILVRELRALYRLAVEGQPLALPPLPLHYKDCVQRETQRLQGPEGEALAAFWDAELADELPVLSLHSDRPRPPVKTENGRVLQRAFGPQRGSAVREAAKALRVTPYMLLLAVYQLFLFLHTGQRRLMIGAPTAGRNVHGSEAVLGHFVNTVVLACELQPDGTFAALVERTRAMMARVLDHQDWPFPLLVERRRPPRDPGRSPVFQVMYNWNQRRADAVAAGAGPALFGATIVASSTGTRGATHDLTLNVIDDGSQPTAAWTYNTDLFDEATIARFAEQYLGLVDQVLVEAQQPLAAYRTAPPQRRAELLARIARAAEPPASQAARWREGLADVMASASVLLWPEGIEPRLAGPLQEAAAAAGVPVVRLPAAPLHALAARDPRAVQALSEAWAAEPRALVVLPVLLAPLATHAPVAVLAYGDHAHALPRRAGCRFLPDAAWQAGVPVLFAPAADGGWDLEMPAGRSQVPLLLGPWNDLADEHQAAGLHLLADPADGMHDAARLADDCRHPADLLNALAGRRLVATPFTVVQRGPRLSCRTPSEREEAAFEAWLAAQPDVREAVRGAAVAYTVPRDGVPAAELEAALRRAARQVWPDARLPRAWVALERLPLTPEGRLDEARLPPPPVAPAAASRGPVSEVERRLAALWSEVLGRGEVGLDDDFFELGGDSILAAVIVSKASLEGLYLQPKDLFEHATIAALAQAVRHTPQVVAEQGAVTGEGPPGPAAAWFFEQVDIDRSHFNQALLLALQEAPEPAPLQEALRQLALQHDVLRSRFVPHGEGPWRQCFDDEVSAMPASCAVVCCVDAGGRTDPARWRQAVQQAQASLDIERGPLWAVRWLEGASLQDSRLLVVAHHLVVDGVSWSILLQDLAALYGRLRSRAAAQRPLKTSSSKAWVEQWRAKLEGDALAEDRRHWLRFAAQLRQTLAGGASVALMRHGNCAPQRPAQGSPGSCIVTLDAEVTTLFRTTAHQAYGTDANDLLAAALHAGFQAWGGSNMLLLDLEGHGRDALAPQVDLSRSVGWFTSIYPVLLEGPGLDEPGQLIKAVKQRLREVPGKGASFGVLRHLTAPDDPARLALASMPSSPVLFTYLGMLDTLAGGSSLYAGPVEPAAGTRSPRQRRTHLLDITAYIAGGRLTLESTFEGGAVVDDSLGCLMQHIETALVGLIHHCCSEEAGGLTPSDVPALQIGQDDLDALLEEVAALER